MKQHLKFVGWVDGIDDDGWTQRVHTSTLFGDEEMWIDWLIPLPEGIEDGYFVSVHRTKAGKWYVVNLSARMSKLTESQIKRARARAVRMRRRIFSS